MPNYPLKPAKAFGPGLANRAGLQVPEASARLLSGTVFGTPTRHDKTTVNPISSPHSLPLRLLLSNLAMMKRILFVALTAFVITLPITGIWSLSLQSQHPWGETRPKASAEQPPKTAELDSVNQYFRSLRYLIEDHESFGPFT